MSKYLNQPLEKYLNDLSARLPAPGGGSAAALVASTGVSLLCMVANFTIDKKGYEEYRDEIKSILAKLEKNRVKLNDLIDEDVAAYEKVSEVYKLPQNTEHEKKQRELTIQSVLKEAMSVPYEIMEISINSISYSKKLAIIGNKSLISDISCGVFFLRSAIEAARDNVIINLNSIKDKSFVEQKTKALELSVSAVLTEIDKIIISVNSLLNTDKRGK